MRTGKGGFTLIEITLVLLLLSLAGLLVYPNLQPLLDRTGREASLRKMTGFLDGVRAQAVAGGKILVLTYDEEENRLVVFGEDGGEVAGYSLKVPVENQMLDLEPERIRYFPQGHSTGLLITFRDPERMPYTIEVGSFTGLSRIVY